MEQIHSTLGAVLRRMKYNLWARATSKLCLLMLCALAVFLLLDFLFYFGPWVQRDLHSLSIMLIAIAIASAAGGLWVALARGPGKLDAAIEVDERLGLKARLSSAVELSDARQPMQQAVIVDAVHWAQRVDVPRAFPIETPRSTWWALIPLALVLLFVLALPPLDLFGRRAEAGAREVELKKQERKEVNEVLRDYHRQVKEFRRQAQKKRMPQTLLDLTDKVSKVTAADDKDRDARAAIKEISKVREKIAEERKRLAMRQDVRKMAQNLTRMAKEGELGRDPATRELARALKDRNLKKAAQELRKLQSKLKEKMRDKRKLSKEEKKEMQKMMQQMAQAASRLRNLQRLQRNFQNAAKNMDENMEQGLQAMELTAEQLEQMEDLTQEMQERDGQNGEDGQYDDLERLGDEMESQMDILDDMLGDLDALREQLGQAARNGQNGQRHPDGRQQGQKGQPGAGGKGQQGLRKNQQGQAGRQGQGQNGQHGMGRNGQGDGRRGWRLGANRGARGGRAGRQGRNQANQGGNGRFRKGNTDRKGQGTGGPGKGRGGNPGEKQEKTDFSTDLRLGGHFHRKGKIVGSLLFKGVPGKGEGLKEYEQIHRAAVQEAEDALSKTRIPKAYEEMVKKYFDDISPEEPADPEVDVRVQ